jgi:hypothetical protein
MEKFSPHLSLAHSYWARHLQSGDIAIDATCGNGYDTVALAQLLLTHPDSLLLGLDVQQTALEKTFTLLRNSFPEEVLKRVLLHRISHADIDRIPLPVPPRLVVYNLGYLPGGDKTITTQTPTTLESLQKAINLLAEDGALSVTCYPGHEEGAQEEAGIVEWAGKLPQERWQVCYHRWINRPASPTFLWIESQSHRP